MIVLDTDVLIEIFDRASHRGAEALRQITEAREQPSTTSLNLHEILYGCLKLAKPATRLRSLPVLPFGPKEAELSSRIESGLEKRGTMVRRIDTMIAAITVISGARLLTYDLDHFGRMKEFGLELFPSCAT